MAKLQRERLTHVYPRVKRGKFQQRMEYAITFTLLRRISPILYRDDYTLKSVDILYHYVAKVIPRPHSYNVQELSTLSRVRVIIY